MAFFDHSDGESKHDIEIRVNDQCEDQSAPTAPTKIQRAKFISQKIKEGAKNLLTHGSDSDSDCGESDLFEDAAFNPHIVLESSPHNRGSGRDRLNRGAKLIVEGVKNPRRAVRDRYTRNAAAKVSKQPKDYAGEYDEALLEAHDALLHAELSSAVASANDSASEISEGHDVELARQRVDEVRRKRNSHRSAWMLGRHVIRAKVIRPATHRPERSDYLVSDPTLAQPPRVSWERYIGHFLLWYTSPFTARYVDDFDEPPFDLRELAHTIERLAVISTPWQSFIYRIRELYRWDDPQRTFRLMSLYWILWYFQQLLAFAIGWAIYFVVQNKFDPTSIRSVRERLRRARDADAKAQAWNEVIQRHGDRDWIEPLLDEIGPLIQMHLGDLASFLEMLQNFYRWERPMKTLATLSFFSAAFLLCLLTSVEFCVRLFTLGCGLVFFFGFPIAARYPKYRHIVNPVNWIFWDIPNSAELAIIQLQEKVILRDARKKTLLEQQQSQLSLTNDSLLDLNMSNPSRSDLDHDSDVESLYTDALPQQALYNDGGQATSSTLHLPISSGNRSRHSSSASTTLSPTSPFSPSHLTDSITFRTVLQTTNQSRLIPHIRSHPHCRLTLTRKGIWLYNAYQLRNFYPYEFLLEICKIDLNNACTSTSHTNDNATNGVESRLGNAGGKSSKITTSSGEKLIDKTVKTIRKVSKWTSLQFLPSGLEFIFLQQHANNDVQSVAHSSSTTADGSSEQLHSPSNGSRKMSSDSSHPVHPSWPSKNESPPPPMPLRPQASSQDQLHPRRIQPLKEKFTLIVSESDRAKIFSLILSWSNQKWQPLFSMDRQTKLAAEPGGLGKKGRTSALDDAIKMALR